MDNATKGWLYGGIGVVIFAGSLPATRFAVIELTPWLVTAVRGLIAGLIALALVRLLKQPRPAQRQVLSLVIIAGGVVVGFPLLTALALEHVSAAHSVVFLGLLPMATAFFGALREHRWPGPLFWLLATLGCGCVISFAVAHISGTRLVGDAFMLAAVIVCGLGYAEGAILARQLGGWQVICWALVISLPLMLALTLVTLPTATLPGHTATWLGLAYVIFFSMLIGFFFWYQGLALGDTTKVSQLQLLQPFIALMLSAALLGDSITPGMLIACCGALLCVAGIKRYA